MHIKKQTRYRQQAHNGSHQCRQISFLPELDFNPIYPLTGTLVYKCLALLLKGQILNHLDFQRATGSWRLAAYIHELKKLGWPICSYEITQLVDSSLRFISVYYFESEMLTIILGEPHNAN